MVFFQIHIGDQERNLLKRQILFIFLQSTTARFWWRLTSQNEATAWTKWKLSRKASKFAKGIFVNFYLFKQQFYIQRNKEIYVPLYLNWSVEDRKRKGPWLSSVNRAILWIASRFSLTLNRLEYLKFIKIILTFLR